MYYSSLIHINTDRCPIAKQPNKLNRLIWLKTFQSLSFYVVS